MYKTIQPPCGRRKCIPLWWLAPPPCPVGSMLYDTESKSRNASCVPFRGRGPQSGEGVDGGKNDYDILILCLIALKGKRLTTFCAPLRSGGRRLAIRTAMEHPIGALPRTPFPASRDFPSRGNEKIGGTGYCVTYDTDSQSRNADFISIAAERQSATLGAKGPVKLKNPWAEGPSILRTYPFEIFIRHKSNKFLTHQYSMLCPLNSLITGNRKDRHRGQDLNK